MNPPRIPVYAARAQSHPLRRMRHPAPRPVMIYLMYTPGNDRLARSPVGVGVADGRLAQRDARVRRRKDGRDVSNPRDENPAGEDQEKDGEQRAHADVHFSLLSLCARARVCEVFLWC